MYHKEILRLWLTLLLVGISLLPTTSLQAQEPGFVETFDDPTLPGWEHSPGVVVMDGLLRIESGNFAFHAGVAGDMALTLQVRRSGEGELVISYNASDAGSYHAVLGPDFLVLQRESGGAITELETAPTSIPPNAWTQVGVTIIQGEHTFTIEEKPVLTATETDPLPPGSVGFEALGEVVGEFDDLTLTSLGASPAPAGPAPEVEVSPIAAAVGVPAYQALPWVRTGGPIGGLGYDIRYNFDDHNLWYVTDAWSGFHLSTDNGLTWTPSNQGITARKGIDAVPIFSATVDPHNPNTIWIGTDLTGEVFKSTDGGHTWINMSNGIDSNLRPLSFRGFTVDPRTSNIVYAMGEIGSPGWTPDGAQRKGLEMDMTQGIVYKTTDGGQHWTQIWRGDNLARYCWIDPRDPNVLFISTGIFDREAANTDVEAGFAGGVGILKSTDGGQTWRVLNQDNGLLDLYIGSLFMNPENPDVLLAAASENNWSFYQGRSTAGIYLTEDGGETWERVLSSQAPTGDGFGELFSVVEYCPSNPNIAYAASTAATYRSDDGGHSWQRFSRPNHTWGPPGIVAGFPIDMQCDPVDPMRVFVNNYLGGNFLSSDGGQNWILASKGYTGALVHHLSIASGRPGTVFAGSRSGVYRSDNGGEEWVGMVYPPQGLPAKFNEIIALAVDPADVNHLLTIPADLGGVLVSDDGGQSWNMRPPLGPVTGLAIAPSAPSKVYMAVTPDPCLGPEPPPYVKCDGQEMGLFVSQDGGASWAPVGGQQVSRAAIATLAVHPADSNTVVVAVSGVGLLKTTDGGKSWSEIGIGLPSVRVRALAITSSVPEVIFAGFGPSEEMGGSGVYRSADGGQTWTHSSAGLSPEASIRSIVIDPTNDQVVYAADNLSGVYVSTDNGVTWRAINDGLIHRTVNVLALSDDGTVLYAGVEGDGVYRLGTPPEAPTSPPEATSTLQPAPTKQAQTQTPAPEPQGLKGFCSGTAALLLALMGLIWTRKRE